MWRKPTDSKSSQAPNAPTPAGAPSPNQVSSNTSSTAAAGPPPAPPSVEAAPVASIPTPAPAAVPSAPVYSSPVTKVVSQDNSAPTSIGAGLKIRGELSGSSDLYIDGDVQGKISLGASRVTVGPKGQVQADIEASDIIIEGNVQGNLKARETVRLGGSSRVQGSIVTPRISIEDGARLRGKVEMSRANDVKPSKSSASTESATAPAYKTVSASTERE
jgi:cytoskeletal protein CcmA (bactofilin family)